jgi:membrane protease YdiL (CAAX protease family)
MNIINSLEKRKINIIQCGILKGLAIFLLAFLLENVFTVPVLIGMNILPKSMKVIVPFVNFTLGVFIKYLVIRLLLRWFSTRDDMGELNYKPISKKYFVVVIAIIMAYRLLYDNSLALWVNQIGISEFVEQAFEELFAVPIIAILAIAVVAPVYEEVIFRGIILQGMAKRINPAAAVIFSSLFFAVMHLNIVQGVNTFILGAILGFVFLKTKSLYASIFGHFINNTLGILLASIQQFIGGENAILIHSVITVIGVIGLVMAVKWFNKNAVKEEFYSNNFKCGITMYK